MNIMMMLQQAMPESVFNMIMELLANDMRNTDKEKDEPDDWLFIAEK